MAHSHLRDSTELCPYSASFEWLLSHKCDTATFIKRSGREGSIFINLWNRDLAATEWFVPWCLGAHCYPQPQKSPVPGTWCKTPCHGLTSHHGFAGNQGQICWGCQSQAGRSCWGRCLPTSPSPAQQWLSAKGQRYEGNPQSESTARSWNRSLA